MFLKKFLSILTYFVWKKVWLLKFQIFWMIQKILSIFSKKKFWKNFSLTEKNFLVTGKIFLVTGKIFLVTENFFPFLIIDASAIYGIYSKPYMYSTTVFQWYILHIICSFSSCPNSYISRAPACLAGDPSSIPSCS